MIVRKVINLLLLLLAAALAVWLARGVGGSFSGAVKRTVDRAFDLGERWCGTQLRAIAKDHLGPELRFDRITFSRQLPLTATLSRARLVAEDRLIMETTALVVVLAGIPRAGEPIVIEAVEFHEPVVRLFAREDGSLVGFDPFVRSSGGSRRADGGSTRLSDVLAIRRLEVRRGRFEHHAPEHEAMELDGIDLELRVAHDDHRPGWHRLDAELVREPVLRLDLDGAMSLDHAILALEAATLRLRLDERQYSVFPGSLQSLLRQHQVRGDLSCRLTGQVPIGDWAESEIDLDATLLAAHAAFGDYVLPVEYLELQAGLGERRARIDSARVVALEGTTTFSGHLELDEPYRAQLRKEMKEVRLERLLAPTGGERPPKFAGLIDASGSVSLALQDSRTVEGGGTVTVRQGQLLKIPLFNRLLAVMKVVPAFDGRDQATARYRLASDHVHFDKLDLISSATAAHGEGEIYYSGALDVRFNAGPLERVQKSLPLLGDALRLLTDRVVTYRATGPLGDPTYRVHPLGIGAGRGPEQKK